MAEVAIAPLSATPQVRGALSEILVEVVASGGSVSFMHPLASEAADAFWERALAAAARGERVVLGAFDGARLVGTVTVLLDCPPNQPHRAEIAKLMTRVGHRGRGIATALMRAAERVAVERDRSLLVLDTAVDGGASALYEGLGFTLAGVIPDYALKPHGGLTGTMVYWKRLGADARAARNERADMLMSPHAASGIGAGSSASTTSHPAGPQINPTG
jgi:ribosomal protein S18 acetylase RimI-like enzyme